MRVPDLARLRLAAQGIDTPRLDEPAAVVRQLLALQAQDFAGAKWAIGLRTLASTDADVEAAIGRREIVRSWPMRGTLHIVPAEDLGWMLSLTGERTVRSAAGRHRALGLDDETFARAAHIAERAVGESGLLSRAGLLAAFEAGGVSVEGQRGAHLLVYLSATGLLVFGPPEGKQHSFALLDEWVSSPRVLDEDAALAEFALRYFLGHGPASVRDFAWWSSLTLTQARRGLASVADQLERLDIDGTQYWHRAGLEPAAPGVATLPGFDEYVLGYQDRSAQLRPEWFERIVPGGNGMFFPTVVVDGQIVGTWKKSATTKAATVTVSPFAGPITPDFARYSAFLGMPVQVVN